MTTAAMTSTLKWCTCWRTVLKNSRTVASVVIACFWWRWHTQHRSLWRPDLVTSCLSLVSWRHFDLGTIPSSVTSELVHSMANATDSRSLWSVSAVRSRESLMAPSDFLPNFTSQIAACVFRSSFSLDSHKKRTYLWNQSEHGLTAHCSCLYGIPPSHVPHALLLGLSVSCPLLPSGSHAHSCCPKTL